MIALYGLPGSNGFAFRRVSSRAEGAAWLDAQLGPCPTQQDLQLRRDSRVVSNRVAAALQWRDGSRIVTELSLAEQARDDADAEVAGKAIDEDVRRAGERFDACHAARGALRCGGCRFCVDADEARAYGYAVQS